MPLSYMGDWWGEPLKDGYTVWWRLGQPLRVSVLLDLDVTQHHRGWRDGVNVNKAFQLRR